MFEQSQVQQDTASTGFNYVNTENLHLVCLLHSETHGNLQHEHRFLSSTNAPTFMLPAGLHNPSVLCYVSSVVVAITSVTGISLPLVQGLLPLDVEFHPVCMAIRHLMDAITTEGIASASPLPLLSVIQRYIGWDQDGLGDAHELLLALLCCVEEEAKLPKNNPTLHLQAIQNCMKISSCTSRSCAACGRVSSIMETDIVLNCSMPPLPSEAWRPSDRNNFEARVRPQIAAVQLQDVVNTLFSPQESSDCCEDCKATHHSNDAPTISSQQLLFSAPPHLCLTLSRFGHSAATGCELNDTPVIIPDILQIPISTLEEGEPAAAGYEVVSMILFNGRHYVTVAKSPTSGRWHLHDDSTVSACARAFVPDGFVPYVLFFTRDTVPLPVLLRGFFSHVPNNRLVEAAPPPFDVADRFQAEGESPNIFWDRLLRQQLLSTASIAACASTILLCTRARERGVRYVLLLPTFRPVVVLYFAFIYPGRAISRPVF